MNVYDGGTWIEASAASQAILVVYQFTATGGQTTFSGTDNNSLTLGYTVGSALVTLNGVMLEVGSEVTASSGTSVVLASGATAGDELNVYAFSTFNLADVYTKAQSDARYPQIDTDTLYVDATNNRVGIGTSSPSSKLHVAGGADSTIRNTASSGSSWFVGSNSSGYILHNESNTPMLFTTNGTERLRIPANASGITFPATQVASSDANTLDDYEEGTFTPSYTSSGISAVTYGTGRNGFYTKVGRVVTITVNIMTDAVTVTNGSSFVFLTGLPFTSQSAGESASTTNIFSSSRFNANPTSGGIITPNSSQVVLYRTVNTTADDPPQSTASDFKTGVGNLNTLRFTATYFTS
jgi:hypothetical protein